MGAGGVTNALPSPVEVVDQLLSGQNVRHVITGEIGAGKSWFAGEVSARARERGVQVVEVGCVEFETDVAFLPLSLLISQVGVSAGDHDALDTLFGVATEASNALSLGTAVAEALHERSAKQPLLVVIDDAHWADSDSLRALLFAARRLDVASVGFVLTAVPGANPRLDRCGLDEIPLVRWSDDRVIRQLIGEGFAPAAALAAVPLASGNALAVELLIDTVDDEQRSGLAPLPPTIALPASLASRVGTDLGDLNAGVRLALAVAAALPATDASLLDDVLVRVGVAADARTAAAALGIVELDPIVRWVSPIVRSAALRLVSRAEIADIHRQIAEAAPAVGLDDLALRHRAAAGIGTDDELADQLEGAGLDAVARGALLTAAEAFRQAALASSQPDDRSRRLGQAANQALGAGNSEQAVPYARAAIEAGVGEEWATATGLLGEAQLWAEGWAAADRTLCDGARLVGDTLPAHAAAMLIHATIHAVVALDAPAASERYALAKVAADRSGNELIQLPVPVIGATARNLAGGARETDRILADAGDLAVAALGYAHPIGPAIAELVGFAAVTREDMGQGLELLRAANDVGRRNGSVGMSAITSFLLTDALWRSGQWAHAQVEIGQAVNLARDSGFEFLAECGEGYRAWVLAATGRRGECVELAELSLRRTEPLELRFLSMWAHAAIGLAALTDGDAESAVDAYDRIDALWTRGDVHEPNLMWWQSDHVEALALAGRTTAAETALDKLASDAELTGRPHAYAAVAKCRALLAVDVAQRRAHLDDAVDRMRKCAAPFDLARCLLLRGQLRLEQRDAAGGVNDLAEARVLFDRLGAHPWSDRASASGKEVDSTPSGLADLLSDAELRVALAIAGGAQNREAAEQLFLSTKTVEYHLSNIYRKLGLRSRVDLARYVADRI